MVKYGNIYYNIPEPYHKNFNEIVFCITCGQKNSPSRQKGLDLTYFLKPSLSSILTLSRGSMSLLCLPRRACALGYKFQ